jgi:hypothetical protein
MISISRKRIDIEICKKKRKEKRIIYLYLIEILDRIVICIEEFIVHQIKVNHTHQLYFRMPLE